jgi:hypothetical protein
VRKLVRSSAGPQLERLRGVEKGHWRSVADPLWDARIMADHGLDLIVSDPNVR